MLDHCHRSYWLKTRIWNKVFDLQQSSFVIGLKSLYYGPAQFVDLNRLKVQLLTANFDTFFWFAAENLIIQLNTCIFFISVLSCRYNEIIDSIIKKVCTARLCCNKHKVVYYVSTLRNYSGYVWQFRYAKIRQSRRRFFFLLQRMR